MKKRKPGQVAKVAGKILRCKRRELGCEGCVLNSISLCPNISKVEEDCIGNSIIFINV